MPAEYPHRSHLDGHDFLRGIAAIVVFLAHAEFAALWPGTAGEQIYQRLFYWHNQAVDIFFTLSGFILFYVHDPRRPAHWKSYLLARIGRIYPLYLVTTAFALSLYLAGSLKRGEPLFSKYPPGLILENFLGVQQWAWTRDVMASINFPAWSISIELLLYLLMFPALRMILRFAPPRFGVAISLAAFFLAANSATQLFSANITSGIFPAWRGVSAFAAGAFLYQALSSSSPKTLNAALLPGTIVLAALCATGIFPREALPLACLPLLFCLSLPKTPAPGNRFSPVCVTLGQLSFAIYLLHFPAIKLFRLLTGVWIEGVGYDAEVALGKKLLFVALTTTSVIGGAWLSYRYLERPSRNAFRKLAARWDAFS